MTACTTTAAVQPSGANSEREADDPFFQGADFLEELWGRLPDAEEPTQAYWARHTAPALATCLAVQDVEAASVFITPALMLLGTEDDESGPYHALLLPGICKCILSGLTPEQANELSSHAPARDAHNFARTQQRARLLIDAGVGPLLHPYLKSRRPETMMESCALLGRLLSCGSVLHALRLLQAEPALATLLVETLSKPYVRIDPDVAEETRSRGRMLDDSLWYWDAHMHLVIGLAHTFPPLPSTDSSHSADTTQLAGLLTDAGVIEALVRVLERAEPARGGFGRPLSLLLRNALVAILSLCQCTAAQSGKQKAQAAGLAQALQKCKGRQELQPGYCENALDADYCMFPYHRASGEEDARDAGALLSLVQQLEQQLLQ